MTDSEYMNRVQACERKLYRISHSILWNDADCADAIQEAVIKGWVKRDTLRNPDWFNTWLIRILINECRNIQRKNIIKPLPLNEAIDMEQPCGDPVEDIHLRAALRKLPEKYRLVLILHHLEGFSLGEMADMLRLPSSLIQSRLHQARAHMRKLLGTGDDSL